MSSPSDAVGFRKSRRLQRGDPEFEALDNPELNFKQKTPLSDRHRSNMETRRKYSEPPSESESGSDQDSEEIVAVSRHSSKNGQGSFLRNKKTAILHEISHEAVLTSPFHQKLLQEPTQTVIVSTKLYEASSSRYKNGGTVEDVNIEVPTNNSGLLSIILLVLCISIGIYYFGGFSSSHENVPKPNLQNLFPSQDAKLWRFISNGANSSEPFVLLLVHHDEGYVTKCLAHHAAKFVADSRTQRPTEPVVVDGKEQASNLFDLRLSIESQGALVLFNVDQLPAESAEFLHFILDVHEPWVPGAVYVLTMNVPSIGERPKNIFKAVHSHLTKKWSSQIKADNLEALITRISNFEYVVRNDNNPCM